jgi:hypothetical protein
MRVSKLEFNDASVILPKLTQHWLLFTILSGEDLGWEGAAPTRLELAEDDDDDYEYYAGKAYADLHASLQNRYVLVSLLTLAEPSALMQYKKAHNSGSCSLPVPQSNGFLPQH